ncbi:MAG: GNAT family N-acetyltransferase [Candidatus Hodarchaeales archaeon]|jgi:GNAT superfamily N-acetyltransferase
MADFKQIKELERIAFNAWPASYCENLGGWILRAANGVTRRANSVFPDGDPLAKDVEAAIKKIVGFYKDKAIIPRFQMTAVSQPVDLDELLAKLGFTVELDVAISITSIGQLASIKSRIPVKIRAKPDLAWLSTYIAGNGYDQTSLEIRKAIVERIAQKKAFAAAFVDDKIVGVGLGVVERGWLGLFSIATLEEHRRQGVATSINRALAAWAIKQGAVHAYLQVFTGNISGLALYHSLGFEEAYRYWYRWLPTLTEDYR